MKSGIDYFPLDIALDEKFDLIEAEFGLTGFGVVVKLLQKIYGGQGYYIEWTDEVSLLFAHRLGLGGNDVSEIVKASIRRGIFNKTLYDKYRILTSLGIQKRYFEAVSRRKSVEVERAYLLFGATQLSENVNIKVKNADIFHKNADISQQSKVEKSRVEKSRDMCAGAQQTHKQFTKPTIDEVQVYCTERKNKIDAQKFCDFYESKGWRVGNQSMKDWQACIRTWEKSEKDLVTTDKIDTVRLNEKIRNISAADI